MQDRSLMIGRRTGILGTIILLVIALGAVSFSGMFGSAESHAGAPSSVQPAASPAQTPLNLNIQLAGAGATFPGPLLLNWTSEYHTSHPNVTMTYSLQGSGRGQSAALNKTVDFGASDAPLSTRQRNLYPGILHIPETIGSVTLSYNLPGVPKADMNMTGPVVADIFLGSITNWNDPAIAALNPGLVRAGLLPNHTILTAHRSDGSGTTFVFTSYLCEESATWCSTVGNGTSVNWPNGVGANGNPGVANYVNSTQYSFGYVELQYVVQGGMTYANLLNNAGNYILPSLQTTFFAVSNYTKTASFPSSSGDWSQVRMLNQPGTQTYPIASFTYLLVWQQENAVPSMDLNDQVQFQTLVNFLNWAVTTGQSYASGLNYVPLPASVVAVDQAGIASMKYTEVSAPVTRNVSLSIGPSGFNGSLTGPAITVVSGDLVNLNLNNLDGHVHQWYIDFNNNGVQDGNETYLTCTSSTLGVAPCTFKPIIWNTRSVPAEGTYTYRDNSTSASGSITVLPQQAAGVFGAPALAVDTNNKALPVLDSSRVATVGSAVIDLRTDIISQNVTIVAADKNSGSVTYVHTYSIPGFQLGAVAGVSGLAVRFVLNVAVGPYALSSDILVQLSLTPICRPTYGATECQQAMTSTTLTRELDMNGHGVVDIADVTTVVAAYGTSAGQPGYNPLADLNGSGTINIVGMGPLLANYGYKVLYS